MRLSEKCSQVKASAKLEIELDTIEEAETTLVSIQPDNHPLPRGIKLFMEIRDRVICVRVECERTVSSLLTTLDDILSMMNLVIKSIKSISDEG